jgi:hypothetical protein
VSAFVGTLLEAGAVWPGLSPSIGDVAVADLHRGSVARLVSAEIVS